MATATRLLNQTRAARRSVPTFLCPILAAADAISMVRRQRHEPAAATRNAQLHTATPKPAQSLPLQVLSLPKSCPGCGAYTQTINPSEPGFYGGNRKSVKTYLARGANRTKGVGLEEADTFDEVLKNADQSVLAQLGLGGQKAKVKVSGESQAAVSGLSDDSPTPICDRCHHLMHHHTGLPVTHPTVRSIHEIISESPYKYNHIYHILDAADFPLSLIPSLQKILSLSPPRSMNRRAKTTHFQHGRTAEISYIITRSDLLAPKKEQVDKLMPYIVEVLRDALGGSARNVRLGNVRCVSSKRGWWTRTVKEDIYDRGGGGWMVGKVNVGKSNLFEHVYPKGRTQEISLEALRNSARDQGHNETVSDTALTNHKSEPKEKSLENRPIGTEEDHIIGESPLPPAPTETLFPTLPLVSSLPGTTASPIRLPFGNGKGELVDLPGLDRGDLESFVTQEHKPDLVMRNRIKARQFTIKPGQSLIVGGLVQLTPTDPDITILAYPFVPLPCHVSSTEKAQSILMQQVPSGVSTIARPGVGDRMHPAGTFALKWDVTKERAGPLTAKAAAGLSVKTLPFVVLSTDVLIEGCGWVELVAQVRKKVFESENEPDGFFDTKLYPMVEVVSPDGKHVGFRRPMGAWLLGRERPGATRGRITRPRRSMRGVKQELKRIARAKAL